MRSPISITVDDGEVLLTLDRAVVGLTDLTEPFIEFHRRMTERVDRTFALAGGPSSGMLGGEDQHRDIQWHPFSPRYTRLDGTVVPAWGGVPRADGRGNVKGARRPSGQRVDPTSLLMQDTGRLRQRATTGTYEVTPTTLAFGPNLPYAAAQNELRSFLDMTETDAAELHLAILDHVLGEG